MGKVIDLTGQKFGRLTVVRQSERKIKDRKAMWECVCECGKSDTRIVIGRNLRNGNTSSCGCYRRDLHTKLFASRDALRELYEDKVLPPSQIAKIYGVSADAVWERLRNEGIPIRTKSHARKIVIKSQGIQAMQEGFKRWQSENPEIVKELASRGRDAMTHAIKRKRAKKTHATLAKKRGERFVNVTCATCGKSFSRLRMRVKDPSRCFCSRACVGRMMSHEAFLRKSSAITIPSTSWIDEARETYRNSNTSHQPKENVS